jgi:hypothetical protein
LALLGDAAVKKHASLLTTPYCRRRTAMTDHQTTHAQDCWSWGHGHYECAVGQVKRDEALLRQALEWIEAQPEPRMIGAAKIITALKERLK